MARLVTSGFEFNGSAALTGPDGGTGGTGTSFDTVTVRSGSRSLKCAPSVSTSNNQWTVSAVTLASDCFLRAYVLVPTGGLPTVQAEILGLGGGGFFFTIRLETNGTLTLWAFIGGAWTQQGSASASLTLDAWNMVELRANVGVGSIDQCEGRLGGASFASASALNVNDTAINAAAVGLSFNGATNTTATVYFDDVAVNDASGAAQTSWPADSKIVLLKPISDNAVGTGWTLGTGTAISSNGFTAVANTPPVGVADLAAGSDPKQIRNASSNANVNYDANLTTYTTAGVGASDTVNVLVPLVATAAPVTTSAKQGTIGISSNPAITNVALGAGGTSGAFWSGAAGAGYATGWKWSYGTTTYAPSVTLGTSPVARITQVTSSTRIAVVCALGMYVDFTPAATIFRPVLTMAPRIPTRRS